MPEFRKITEPRLGDYTKEFLTLTGDTRKVNQPSAWLSRYIQASFRGVEFFITRSTRNFGRKQVGHSFPSRDDVQTEDLGRKARSFSFDAYIVGDDYFQHRENLISALETEGMGVLMHPYLGRVNVVSTGTPTCTETTTDGRMAKFSLSFREDIPKKLTIKKINHQLDVNEKTETTYDKLRDAFAEAYDLASQPAEVAQQVLVALDDAVQLVYDAKKVVGAVAEFQAVLANIKGKLIELGFISLDLFNEFLTAITFGTNFTSIDFATGSRLQFYEMKDLAENLSSRPLSDDPTVQAVNNMLINIALVTMNEMIATIVFDSQDDAEDVRNTSFVLLNQVQASITTSDEVFGAIADNKASIEEYFEESIASLGQLFSYDLNQESTNSLQLTYSIYGSFEREEEILVRNKIQDPFFVDSGKGLQVVINVE